jgi:HSP20 family molecular chaperone IbpA
MDDTVARIFFDRRDFDAFRSLGDAQTVEYRPPVDVIETAGSVEVVADLPGVPAESVRVTFAEGTLVISGRKRAPQCAHREAAFHLAERTFGHFACAVRCEMAVDAGRARATLASGELHIVLPRIDERRGREIPIAIEPQTGAATT